jgi:hypothetical protein
MSPINNILGKDFPTSRKRPVSWSGLHCGAEIHCPVIIIASPVYILSRLLVKHAITFTRKTTPF